MSDPNIEGQIELTCANCGFKGTPLVAAAHDCNDYKTEGRTTEVTE